MKITDIYNAVGSGIQKATKPIKDYFAPATIKYGPYADPIVPSPASTRYPIVDRGVHISDEDLKAIRPLIYGEVSNRTPDKQKLEADVIFNTAINRLKAYKEKGLEKTLSDVVSMPNQYQAYGGPQYQTYHNPVAPGDIAKKQTIDSLVDNLRDRIKRGEFKDNTNGAYYYIHNKDGSITYDDVKKLFAK